MKDTIMPGAPSTRTFTELNVRQEKGKPHYIRLHDSVATRLERQLGGNPASTCLLLASTKRVTDRAAVEFPFNLRELGAEEPPTARVAAAVVAPPAMVTKAGRGGLAWKIGVSGVVVIASVFGLGELRVFDRQDAQPADQRVMA